MPRSAQIRTMPVVEYARAHTESMISVLVDIALSGTSKEASRVAAAVAVLNRGWGTPPQSLIVNGEKPKEFDMSKLSAEELRQFHAMLGQIVEDAEVVSANEDLDASNMKRTTPVESGSTELKVV